MAGDQGSDRDVYADVVAVEFADIADASEIMQFHAYWRSIAKADALPARRDMDPVDIPTIIPWMFLIDVLRADDTLDFRFRLIGTRNGDLVGQDATGKRVHDAFPEATANLMSRSYAEVVAEGRPLCWRASVPDTDRAHIECYRALFPFAADGRTVDIIAGLLMPVDNIRR